VKFFLANAEHSAIILELLVRAFVLKKSVIRPLKDTLLTFDFFNVVFFVKRDLRKEFLFSSG
jgi:hypothetical protein